MICESLGFIVPSDCPRARLQIMSHRHQFSDFFEPTLTPNDLLFKGLLIYREQNKET